MKTHVFPRWRYCLIVVNFMLVLSANFLFAADTHLKAKINGKPSEIINHTIFVKSSDHLEIYLHGYKSGLPIRWYWVEPQARDYNNFEYCEKNPGETCSQPIDYKIKEIKSLLNQRYFNSTAILEPRGEGTYFLQYKFEDTSRDESKFSSTDKPRGLQVVVRRDDSYIGYLTELKGLPFVYWPKEYKRNKHQTESRIGADCVALVIYGQRRLGRKIRYFAPSALNRYTIKVPGTKVKPGDILHFGFQTAVLTKDTPPLGRINASDLIIHSYHGLVEEVIFAELSYKASDYSILRWD